MMPSFFKTGARILLRMSDWQDSMSPKSTVGMSLPGLEISTLSSKTAILMPLPVSE
jgi:hypothetical protein